MQLGALVLLLLLSTSPSPTHAAGAVAAAGAAGDAACAEGCYRRGNCNLEERRCECPLGFGGPSCEEPYLSACQHAPDGLPFWGLFQPKSCMCYKQAAVFFNCSQSIEGLVNQDRCQLASYQYRLLQGHCYQYTDRPDTEQRSMMPEEGAPNVAWYRLSDGLTLTKQLSEEEGRKALDLWGHMSCVALPPHLCLNNCSMQGACVKDCKASKGNDVTTCKCFKGFQGPDCSQVDLRFCPNKCSGRGTCLRGFCHCPRPFFGIDCSRSKSFPPRPDAVPTRKRPVVYMYELPNSVSSPAVGLDDNVHDVVAIYSADTHFLNSFLQDWGVRTEDPWEANLFYVPAHTYCYASNNGDPGPHLLRVLRYIQEAFPFYNRSGGKDHFMWFTGDQGSCRSPPEALSVMQLVHFGYHKSSKLQGPSNNGVKLYDPVHGCFNPARDVVAAPYSHLGVNQAAAVYERLLLDKGHDPNRTHLFFFAGGVRSERHAYSGGVRQAIYSMLQHLRNSTQLSADRRNNTRRNTRNTHADQLSDVVFIEGHTQQYAELYATSRFCLAPHGSGFGIRLSIAMVHGCIPVIIQNHVYQPFEDLIPYEDMTVRISRSQIPDLIPILRGISEEEQAAMRLVMARHYRAFIWEPHLGGMAYNYTIHALYRRLHALWGELYKHRST